MKKEKRKEKKKKSSRGKTYDTGESSALDTPLCEMPPEIGPRDTPMEDDLGEIVNQSDYKRVKSKKKRKREKTLVADLAVDFDAVMETSQEATEKAWRKKMKEEKKVLKRLVRHKGLTVPSNEMRSVYDKSKSHKR